MDCYLDVWCWYDCDPSIKNTPRTSEESCTASHIPEIAYHDDAATADDDESMSSSTDVLFQSAQKVASKRNGAGGTDGIYKDDVDDETLTTRNSFTIV